jgi:hypothetical protein
MSMRIHFDTLTFALVVVTVVWFLLIVSWMVQQHRQLQEWERIERRLTDLREKGDSE